MSERFNTASYWDAIYAREGARSWRLYPVTARKIRELLPPGQRILELGGGPGILALALQKDGHKVVMIDHSAKAVDQAKRRGVELAIVGNVPECLDAMQADFVVACEFLEHFENPKKILAAAAIAAPNAIYAVPNDCLGDHPEHSQQFNRDALMEILAPFYHRVEIFEIVDEWNAKLEGIIEQIQPIRLPVLIALCRGTRE